MKGYNTRGDADRCCTKAPYYASNELAGEVGLEVGDRVYTWVRNMCITDSARMVTREGKGDTNLLSFARTVGLKLQG